MLSMFSINNSEIISEALDISIVNIEILEGCDAVQFGRWIVAF
jgi:hypothetical protein